MPLRSVVVAKYVLDPSAWPLLLVGPIVRRVTKTSVAVFVATSAPASVTLTITDSPSSATGVGTPVTVDTIALGARLHVRVVEVVGLALVIDKVYGYEIALQPKAGGAKQTTTGMLLGNGVPIGYRAGERPSFMLPSKRDKLGFVHASCRKPHGGGPDMLPLVDGLVGASRIGAPAEGARVRPQQLFLTGDQIYADDVAPGLLGALREAGDLLLGWSTPESLPLIAGTSAFLAPGYRSLLLDAHDVRPRTAYSDNHLLHFGEWCAMYVMAWSDAIWRRDPQGNYTLPTPVDLALQRIYGTHDSATLEAIEYAKRLPFVRRALANVATYMMFDDHEVTDDWYVNAELDIRLRKGLGKRIVRNGLLGYAIFQDWGNRPGDYQAGHGATLLSLLTCPSGGSPPLATPSAAAPGSNSTVEAVLDVVLDIGTARAPTGTATQRKRWDYVIDGDDHRVIALDCRTFRELPTLVNAGPQTKGQFNAGLIDDAAQALQIDPHLATLGDRELFLISPAPVIGMWIVEVLQKLMIAKHPDIGTEEFDNEPWAGNAKCFRQLLDRLSPQQPVVFLSGDVHYAFTQDVKRCVNGQSSRFIQLCSSSTKNSEAKTALLSIIELFTAPLLRGDLRMTVDELGRFVSEQGPDLQARLRETIAAGVWDMFNDAPDPLLHGSRALYTGADELVELGKDLGEFAISPGMWLGIELYEHIQLGAVEADQTVQLIEQTQQKLDAMGVTQRPTTLYVQSVTDESRPNEELRDDHGTMLRLQLQGLPTEARRGVLRRNLGSIGDSNIGLITFEKKGTTWDLLHDLYWSHLRTPLAIFGGVPALTMYTRHRVPMTPADPCP